VKSFKLNSDIMKTYISVILLAISISSFSQHEEQKYVPETDPVVLENLEKWQDMKFGLLMHWGPYSQWGVVESWSICAEDEGWCRRKSDNYVEYKKEYEDLKTTFNPVQFAPEKWAQAASEAGMKYMVFTTKHHDGFSMFDSKYTDYKITDPGTPFSSNPKANITKELFNAFRSEGLKVGAYFSKPDWHSEYYWWPNFATPDRNVNYDINTYPDRWEKFVEFTHNQIMELMTDYGKVDILWLDGGWVQKLTRDEVLAYITSPNYKFSRIQSQDIRMDELVQKTRKVQPGLIVVDRAVPGKNQNYLTPENRVPEKMLPYPWESCIIMGGGWSYSFNATYKSGKELVHMLVDIVAKGGNLLLNIGPGPDGTWHDDAYDRLKKIGSWMKVNNEAIYNTRAIEPYKEGNVCLTQQKDGSVYAIYLDSDEEITLPARIHLSSISPSSKAKINMLGVKGNLRWKKDGNGFYVDIPEKIRKNPPCKYAWTLKISEIN